MTEPGPPSGDHASSTAFTADPVPPAGPRGYVALSWLAILAVVGWLVYSQNFAKRSERADAVQEGSNLAALEMNVRVQVGMTATLPVGGAEREKIANAVGQFYRGSVEQRMMVAIALGEILGPKAAKKILDDLDTDVKRHEAQAEDKNDVKPDDRRRLGKLIELYGDYVDGRPEAPLLGPVDREELLKEYGWFGQLALGPPIGEPNANRQAALAAARTTFLVVMGAGIGILVAFLLGVGILGMILIAWYRGRWRRHLRPAVAWHGVYVETFAIWLISYLALLRFGMLTLHDLVGAFDGCAAMALSLIVLAWPVARGIRWKQVRRDIGWTAGETPLLEPTFGFLSYFACVPLLAIGVIWFVLYNKLTASTSAAAPADPFAPDRSAAHPIIQQLSSGSMADWAPLFLLACVLAPVVEETFFRGLLYRHVRDATRHWTFGFVLSVFAVSVLFAMVHPQGVVAVPLLASLACGFALAREWRDTLIPGIIAHGFNNTLILAFAGMCLMR